MKRYQVLAGITAILALAVIVLGAYVRLSDAGLGCPDWPGCYGKVTWPTQEAELEAANQAFPERPVETDKAWKEMAHRYLAGGLGILVLVLTILAIKHRERHRQPVKLPIALLILVIFQAALGMWTVTLLLKPAIVMAHLLGGMATFALLVWLYLRSAPIPPAPLPAQTRRLRLFILPALVLLLFQIALGGWVSTNYASLACLEFPTCNSGVWWPETDFKEGFTLWRGVGVNYEGGILDQPARNAIHLAHRIGAVVVATWLAITGIKLLLSAGLDRQGRILLSLTAIQVLLGILNVVLKLPLANAVAHTGVAALLLANLLFAMNRCRDTHPP